MLCHLPLTCTGGGGGGGGERREKNGVCECPPQNIYFLEQ